MRRRIPKEEYFKKRLLESQEKGLGGKADYFKSRLSRIEAERPTKVIAGLLKIKKPCKVNK